MKKGLRDDSKRRSSLYIMKHIITTLVFIGLFGILFAQDSIQDGFQALDSGNYENAIEIFSKLERNQPENISAQVGYGRALGLSGKAGEAHSYFNKKLKSNPDNEELKLNFGESYLWLGESIKGEEYYRKLVAEYPENFISFLGLGNALAMQGKFSEALIVYRRSKLLKMDLPFIDEQIKNARLGQAYEFRLLGNYSASISIYKQLVNEFPSWEDARLGYGGILLGTHDFRKAEKQFKSLLSSKKYKITALQKLSYIKHQLGRNKEALELAGTAYEAADSTNVDQYLEASKSYLFALLWNKRFSEAERIVSQLSSSFPEGKIQVALAQYASAKGRFSEVEFHSKKMIELDSGSYDGNLGLANNSFALGDFGSAGNQIETMLHFFPNHPDGLFVRDLIRKKTSPTLSAQTSYLTDNGNNRQLSTGVGIAIPVGEKLFVTAGFRNYQVRNTELNEKANIQYPTIGLGYQSKRLAIKVDGGLALKKMEGVSLSNDFTFRFRGNYKMDGNHLLSIFAERRIYDYTTSLVGSGITFTGAGVEYSGNIKQQIGLFVQGMRNFYSDGNGQNILTMSVFRNLKERPLIKTGLNLQIMQFSEQVPLDYYSPSSLVVGEAFLEYNSIAREDKKIGIRVEVVPGVIKEAGADIRFSYRGLLELGFRPSPAWEIKAKANVGNFAANEFNGYSFRQFGLSVKWYLLKFSTVVKN